jgi:DNA-binding HxlR family transcriptional regulator
VARSLEVVGEKWALLAVREVFLGNRRFDEMVRRIGAPRDTLAARLRTLVEAGIFERRQYSDHPARFEYFLTDAGKDLYPVIVTLRQWGDRHLSEQDGPPAIFKHTCGHPLMTRLVCESCGEPASLPSRPPTPTHQTGQLRRPSAGAPMRAKADSAVAAARDVRDR